MKKTGTKRRGSEAGARQRDTSNKNAKEVIITGFQNSREDGRNLKSSLVIGSVDEKERQ